LTVFRCRERRAENPDGKWWKLSQEDTIRWIKGGQGSFFVNRGGRVVKVIVAISRYANEYIKTEADGEQPDNLLSLYECVW
jgi:hypothetical protein